MAALKRSNEDELEVSDVATCSEPSRAWPHLIFCQKAWQACSPSQVLPVGHGHPHCMQKWIGREMDRPTIHSEVCRQQSIRPLLRPCICGL